MLAEVQARGVESLHSDVTILRLDVRATRTLAIYYVANMIFGATGITSTIQTIL